MNKDQNRDDVIEGIIKRVKGEYEKYHNDLTFKWNGKEFWVEQIGWKLADTFIEVSNEQRQKDLKAISLHSGIPLDVLQGYLTAKQFDIKDIEVPDSVAGD